MKYAIVYHSQTGNTAKLAEALRAVLPAEELVHFGPPGPEAAEAPLLFVGFWTDKGSCDPGLGEFLATLRGKKLFLFGTAGFGGEAAYFQQILDRAAGYLDASNTLIGKFMCQGRMPAAVRARYEAMPNRDSEQVQAMLENFDRAMSHPDGADLERLTALAREALAAAAEESSSLHSLQ